MKNKISILRLAIIFVITTAFSGEVLCSNSAKERNILKKNIVFKNRSSELFPYNSAVGICGGLNSGLTFKHFLNDENAFEIILGTRWKGISVTGFYEICIRSEERNVGLMWNFGGGLRLGFYNGKYYQDFSGGSREYRSYSIIGIAGTIGFEYYFENSPLSIGLDYRPFFDLKGQDESILDAAVSLRYFF